MARRARIGKKTALQLNVLRRSSPKVRRQLINTAPDDLIRTISECSLNVLRGNVRLNQREKRRLKPYRTILRGLTTSRSAATRRRLINQKGGFLGALIGPLLGAVLPAVGKLFGLK